MPKFIVVPPGTVFTRLTVIREVNRGRFSERWFECKCECGTVKDVALAFLRNGDTRSCGCLMKEFQSKPRTHGFSKKTEYSIWNNIRARCRNKSHISWKHYGGRGVTVCEKWATSFAAFLGDVGVRPSLNHSIDRYPDKNGNYEPGNVRWATRIEQQRNREDNIHVTYNGQDRLLCEVCEELGLRVGTIRARQIAGWPDSDIFQPIFRIGSYGRWQRRAQRGCLS